MKPLEIKEGESKVISNKYIDASNFYKKISPGLSHADFELTFQLVNSPFDGSLDWHSANELRGCIAPSAFIGDSLVFNKIVTLYKVRQAFIMK